MESVDNVAAVPHSLYLVWELWSFHTLNNQLNECVLPPHCLSVNRRISVVTVQSGSVGQS